MTLKNPEVEGQSREVVVQIQVRHGDLAFPVGLQVRQGHPQEGLSFQSCCPADRATGG